MNNVEVLLLLGTFVIIGAHAFASYKFYGDIEERLNKIEEMIKKKI